MEPLLDIRDLHKRYTTAEGTLPVLSGVSVTLGTGETLALTGESGSGKSTLLHLAAGLDQPDSGAIRIGGTDLAGLNEADRARMRRDRIGLVFQQFNLIPSLDVWKNVRFQARLSGRNDDAFARHLIDRLGLEAQAARYPEQLSGGQQQRVAIARALAGRPDLILADEPTGNLDETTGDGVLDLLLDLVRETGAGMMMVTHSSRLAQRLDRLLHLSHGALSEDGSRAAGVA